MYNFVVNYQTEYFLNILVWLFTPHFVMNKCAVSFSLIFGFFCFKLYNYSVHVVWFSYQKNAGDTTQ